MGKVIGNTISVVPNPVVDEVTISFEVKVHAEQLPPTEGMLKLSDYLTQMLEPSLIPLTADPSK